jgi:hypothetical protein
MQPKFVVTERSSNEFVDLRLTVVPARWRLKLPDTKAMIAVPTFQPYRATSGAILERFKLASLFPFEILFRLSTDVPTAGFAWEALLSLAHRRAWACFHYVREGSALPKPPSGIAQWRNAGVYVVSRAAAFNPAHDAWTIPGSPGAVGGGEEVPGANSPLRVLHLVGRARSGASGPVFSVGRREGGLGEAIGIDALPLADAAIVLIQEEPAERLRRLDIDRQQSADARGFAAEVFRAGAHTVILVPGMPVALSWGTIRALAGKIAGEQAPDLWRTVSAARAARQAVLDFKPRRQARHAALVTGMDDDAVTDALRELALEITVFTRSEHFAAEDTVTQLAS